MGREFRQARLLGLFLVSFLVFKTLTSFVVYNFWSKAWMRFELWPEVLVWQELIAQAVALLIAAFCVQKINDLRINSPKHRIDYDPKQRKYRHSWGRLKFKIFLDSGFKGIWISSLTILLFSFLGWVEIEFGNLGLPGIFSLLGQIISEFFIFLLWIYAIDFSYLTIRYFIFQKPNQSIFYASFFLFESYLYHSVLLTLFQGQYPAMIVLASVAMSFLSYLIRQSQIYGTFTRLAYFGGAYFCYFHVFGQNVHIWQVSSFFSSSILDVQSVLIFLFLGGALWANRLILHRFIQYKL